MVNKIPVICYAIYYQFAMKIPHVYIFMYNKMLLFCYISTQRSPSAGDQYSWKIATVRNGELKMMMSIDRKPTRSKHIIYTTTLHFNWMAGLHFDWLIDWLIESSKEGVFVPYFLWHWTSVYTLSADGPPCWITSYEEPGVLMIFHPVTSQEPSYGVDCWSD